MPYIYLFQLAQSSYGYKEHLVIKTENKEALLDFGFWRTDICREIYKKASEISAALLQVNKLLSMFEVPEKAEMDVWYELNG